MAYISGTANGHIDLLKTAINFVTTHDELVNSGQNWEILQEQSDPIQYFLKAPGLSGKEQIYINIAVSENSISDYYNWLLYGAQGYDPVQSIINQPKTYKRTLALWNQEIPFWLVANGQRLIVIAKISTTYTMCYLGKFFPYATPNQYAYPVFIAGDHSSDSARWSDTTANHRTFQSTGSETAYLYLPDGIAQTVRNRYASGSNEYYQGRSESYGYLLPTHSGALTSTIVQQNQDGSYTLLPYVLGSPRSGGNVLGELDGAYWITGHNNASENIITIDNQDYLVVQNIHRTAWIDYCAIKLA